MSRIVHLQRAIRKRAHSVGHGDTTIDSTHYTRQNMDTNDEDHNPLIIKSKTGERCHRFEEEDDDRELDEDEVDIEEYQDVTTKECLKYMM